MKKLFMVMLIILITIQEGQVISKHDCLIMLDRISNNRAYFQPDMAVERFIMTGGNRRLFESDNKEYFFDVLKITENKVSFDITEKK